MGGAEESIPEPTPADGPEMVEVEGERSPYDIDQELEPVYAVNQSDPLDLDETEEDFDEEFVEGELAPGDNGGEGEIFFNSSVAPVDFDDEAESTMVEKNVELSPGEEDKDVEDQEQDEKESFQVPLEEAPEDSAKEELQM